MEQLVALRNNWGKVGKEDLVQLVGLAWKQIYAKSLALGMPPAGYNPRAPQEAETRPIGNGAKPVDRPPAVYSNNGYLSLLEKYG